MSLFSLGFDIFWVPFIFFLWWYSVRIFLKKITKKKSVIENKNKPSKISKKSTSKTNPLELLFKENESQLISLITKEFDKELASKAKTYIKSYSKIEESIITVSDFLNYIENLDEDLFKLFKAISKNRFRPFTISEKMQEVYSDLAKEKNIPNPLNRVAQKKINRIIKILRKQRLNTEFRVNKDDFVVPSSFFNLVQSVVSDT